MVKAPVASHIVSKLAGEPISLVWGAESSAETDAFAQMNVYQLDGSGNILQFIGGTGTLPLPQMSTIVLDASGPVSDLWPVNQGLTGLLEIRTGFEPPNAEGLLPFVIAEHLFSLTVKDDSPPVVPPSLDQFRNVSFTLTTFIETVDGPIPTADSLPGLGAVMGNMSVASNMEGRLVMSVSGEYMGTSPAFLAARLFAIDPKFGGVSSNSAEVMVPPSNIFESFGPIQVVGLSWPAGSFPIGDTWQTVAELIATNGEGVMLGDFALFDKQETVKITKNVFGQAVLLATLEVIDQIGQHTDDSKITIGAVGDSVTFVSAVRNMTSIPAEVDLSTVCGFFTLDVFRRLKFNADPDTLIVDRFVLEPGTQIALSRSLIIDESCRNGVRAQVKAPSSDNGNWWPKLLNPNNLDVIFTGQIKIDAPSI